MTENYFVIDPDEKLDFSFDWSSHLQDPPDGIQNSTWSIDPLESVALEVPQLVGNVASVLVSNCTRGRIYRLTNRLSTNQGRNPERSWILRCEHK